MGFARRLTLSTVKLLRPSKGPEISNQKKTSRKLSSVPQPQNFVSLKQSNEEPFINIKTDVPGNFYFTL